MAPEFKFDEQIDSGENRMAIRTAIAYGVLIGLIPLCVYFGYLGYLATTP